MRTAIKVIFTIESVSQRYIEFLQSKNPSSALNIPLTLICKTRIKKKMTEKNCLIKLDLNFNVLGSLYV